MEFVIGNLNFKEEGDPIDCAKSGLSAYAGENLELSGKNRIYNFSTVPDSEGIISAKFITNIPGRFVPGNGAGQVIIQSI
jgi:hypothetical protein